MAHTTAEVAGGLPASEGTGILDMVLHAGPMVRAIMAGLLVLSLVCWAIIASKSLQLRRAKRESETFVDLFIKCDDLGTLFKEAEGFEESHLAHIFRVGYGELNRVTELLTGKGVKNFVNHADLLLENVDRSIQGGVISKRKRLQRLLPFLATTGSTAPFIGLFGTVWGIMTSFQDIGMKGSANLAVVAPGISEALVATAMGLAAAIPAVVAYNHFSNRIEQVEDEMLQFVSDFLNTLKTDFACETLRKEAPSGPSGIARERRGICGCMDEGSAQTG